MRHVTMAALAAMTMAAGCGGTNKDLPALPGSAAAPIRLPAGAMPEYDEHNGMGEAPSCSTTYSMGNDQPVPVGAFTGTCGDHELHFVGVQVHKVDVGAGIGDPSLVWDHTQNVDTGYSLRVTPLDDDGKPFAHFNSSHSHLGVWTADPACQGILEVSVLIEGGKDDSASIKALAPGTCKVTVDYLGAVGSATITIK